MYDKRLTVQVYVLSVVCIFFKLSIQRPKKWDFGCLVVFHELLSFFPVIISYGSQCTTNELSSSSRPKVAD